MKHVVFFSSGIGSWATAKRVAEQHGTEDLILLFADTLIEDSDNYRFLGDAARNIGAKLIRVSDGRTPFEVFKKERILGNSRIAPCSHILKQQPCLKWLKENDPNHEAHLYVGISWDEIHRLPAIAKHWQPWKVSAPLTEAPYLDKLQILNWAASEGLQPPRTYQMGLPHANCLTRGCVRGGQAYWKQIYKVLPESFAAAEREEQELRDFLGRNDVSHLSRTVDGRKVPYTLAELRADIEADAQLDLFDWAGCGCFTESSELEEVAA